MAYRYLAVTADGTETQGVLEVETEGAAERMLWERKLTIVDLQPLKRRLDLATLFPSVLGPKPRDIVLFSRQLATLVDSGVAITSALQLLSGQVSNRYLARVLSQVEDDLHMGVSLSEAMAKHPVAFSELYVRMVETGERSGNLGQVLNQLADYTEKVQTTLGKVRGAMIYPAFVMVLAVFVVILLVNVALPPMVRLFEEFDAVLPWPTRFLIGVTKFSADYGLTMAIVTAVLSVAIFIYAQRPSGRLLLHRVALRLPLFGKVIINGAVARLSRTMSALIRSGLALPEVIALSSQTIGNQILQRALDEVRHATLQGRGLSEPLSQVRYFPRMMSYLARVGEETGTLDAHLATVADFYEGEVDRMLKLMTTVLEPALIIVIGVIVGFVAIAIILPMYDLLGQIQI